MVLHPVRTHIRNLMVAAAASRRFRRELYPHWRPLLVASLCSLAYSVTRLAEPWPLKFIFDTVLYGMELRTPWPWVNHAFGDNRVSVLLVATGVILALALLRGVFYYHQSVVSSRVAQEVVFRVRARLFAHVQRLSLSFHRGSRTGDLLTRLTGDVAMLRDLLVGSLLTLVAEAGVVLGFVTVMVLMSWRLALLALVVVPFSFLGFLVYSSRIREATREQRRRESDLASRLAQVLSGIHVVQMFARERQEDERLGRLSRRSFDSGLTITRLEARFQRVVEFALAVTTAATVWVGATEVMAGRLTAGDLIVFLAYMQGFYRPVRRISRVAERAGKASGCIERVSEVLDRTPEVSDGPRTAPRFRGAVCFDSIEFAYTPGVAVVRSIDLAVRPGERIALVGPSGEGKSTLLGLIPRLWDPTGGRVLIDGHDVRQFTLKSLRDQISVVPQDGMLFGGTIRENIAYGKPEATEEEIVAAARAAGIHDFVAATPNGYATVIGERGVTLSGGQRQRLAIARAMVKAAPIVLLDEPTTGLDAEAEALVLSALDRLLSGRTAIIIAHRLPTIRSADVILVIEDGRVVERGCHEDLMVLGGRYRRLYERQLAQSDTRRQPMTDP